MAGYPPFPLTEPAQPLPYAGSLRRVLSLPALTLFGLVYMVPLTVFTTYGVVTQVTGGRTALAYLLTLLSIFFTALSYSRMVDRYPVAGSAYSYARKSFGPMTGFLAGWSLLLDYLFLPMINYLVIGIYLHQSFPQVPAWGFIATMIALVTVLNVLGIQSVSRFGNALIAAQLVFVLVFVGLAARQIMTQTSVDLLAPWQGDGSAIGMAPVLAGAAILCLSFLGFDAVSTLAEEAREPRRDIPRAIIMTTIGAGLLFILLAAISQLAFPGSRFQHVDSAANEVMQRIAGPYFVSFFFTASYVAGAFGSALASQASVSRILYSMGRDRVLPHRVFAGLSQRFNTPIWSILVVSLCSTLALVIDLATLASLISFGALVAFSVVNLAVIKTYLLDGKPHPFSAWMRYGSPAAIGFALTLWLWTSLSALTLQIGLGWLAAGMAYLLCLTRGLRKAVPTVQFDNSES
ncbi:APC family permease [Chromobacterium haemolyticum]|nr:APC family permease [Chromobacterium haemolyticum]